MNKRKPHRNGDGNEDAGILRIVEVMREVERHVGEQQVVAHVGGNHPTDTLQQAMSAIAVTLLKRDFLPLLPPLPSALPQLPPLLLTRRPPVRQMPEV